MINPSAPGWIDKFFIEHKFSEESIAKSDKIFYNKVRKTGFIYGHIVTISTQNQIQIVDWFKSEISKIALLNTLFELFCLTKNSLDSNEFIKQSVAFYNEMNPQGFNLFHKILPTNNPSITLEKIIDERVQTNENSISKNFTHLVTNALLFIDVLAFQSFLIHGMIPEKYLKKVEENVINVLALALQVKSNKSQHDDLLIKLFESSIRYSKFSKVTIQNLEQIELNFFTTELEKKYIIDIAGMALWSDGVIENNEAYFLYKLAEIVMIPEDFVSKSIQDTNNFILQHKKEIPYFNHSNPVKHFYDHTTQSVVTLITRNKNRLIKEILQSKELMVLLAYSTRRDLNEKEKKKVKKQLLDICKTIPSLTIFLLPGGSLLLPILIKFIPTLLPSAFNENLND
ncbi:LETM1-related biofilm-associated protein [Flavobacterium myungsuense]|uniref:LETM1-related biofilm-associated protein n=2 Tax=Flavobacterium myungsuense TaxID=651823 RepID=A0ABW3J170_9FLAO